MSIPTSNKTRLRIYRAVKSESSDSIGTWDVIAYQVSYFAQITLRGSRCHIASWREEVGFRLGALEQQRTCVRHV